MRRYLKMKAATCRCIRPRQAQGALVSGSAAAKSEMPRLVTR